MHHSRSGFTLIELSIVLVIIGLIVGGILVGQDLIKGAQVRAAVSQFEKYDAAANTFRGKYKGLPGDLLSPSQFGFDSTNLVPNGNGKIDRIDSANTNGNANSTYFVGESPAFFRHLYQANLIAENISTIADFDAPFGTLPTTLPASKLSAGGYIFSAVYSGLNYYYLFQGVDTDATSDIQYSDDGYELRVIDAFQLDSKMDDGVANSGRVIVVTDFVTADAGNTCHTSGVYNTATSGTEANCLLRIRTSF